MSKKRMTKKELIQALAKYDDDDEIMVDDTRYHNEEYWVRNVWIDNVGSCVCANKVSAVLHIESDMIVHDLLDARKDCFTCKYRKNNDIMDPCTRPELSQERDAQHTCICSDMKYYEFFNSTQRGNKCLK